MCSDPRAGLMWKEMQEFEAEKGHDLEADVLKSIEQALCWEDSSKEEISPKEKESLSNNDKNFIQACETLTVLLLAPAGVLFSGALSAERLRSSENASRLLITCGVLDRIYAKNSIIRILP